MKFLLAAALALAMSACGLVAPITGNADYSYTEYDAVTGKPTCKVQIKSGRVVDGVNVKGCGGQGLEASAANLKQGNSTADLTALLQTVQATLQPVLGAQQAPAPAPTPTPPPDGTLPTFLRPPDN